MRFRRFDADLDDFVDLEKPEPWTRDMLDELRTEMHRAWLNEQARESPPRAVRPEEPTRPASMWGEE